MTIDEITINSNVPTIETLTLNQLTAMLRSAGLKISETILADGIEQGVFPFGTCVNTEKGGRRFLIFKRQVDDWIKERAS